MQRSCLSSILPFLVCMRWTEYIRTVVSRLSHAGTKTYHFFWYEYLYDKLHCVYHKLLKIRPPTPPPPPPPPPPPDLFCTLLQGKRGEWRGWGGGGGGGTYFQELMVHTMKRVIQVFPSLCSMNKMIGFHSGMGRAWKWGYTLSITGPLPQNTW